MSSPTSNDRPLAAIDALSLSELAYRELVENIGDLVLRVRDDCICWVSPTFTSVTGWPASDLIGRPFACVLHDEDRHAAVDDRRNLSSGSSALMRYRVKRTDGGDHWVEDHVKRYANGFDDATVHSLRVIDDRVASERDLHRRATVDELTGLLSRSEILSRLASPLDRRHLGALVAVLFCDVDGLKVINDTHGHQAGDALLHHIACAILDSIRVDDIAARIGGDEFVVLLNRVETIDDAISVAEKIRLAARRPLPFGERALHATVSIGVVLSEPDRQYADLLNQADRAMYRAKRAGRDRICVI